MAIYEKSQQMNIDTCKSMAMKWMGKTISFTNFSLHEFKLDNEEHSMYNMVTNPKCTFGNPQGMEKFLVHGDFIRVWSPCIDSIVPSMEKCLCTRSQ